MAKVSKNIIDSYLIIWWMEEWKAWRSQHNILKDISYSIIVTLNTCFLYCNLRLWSYILCFYFWIFMYCCCAFRLFYLINIINATSILFYFIILFFLKLVVACKFATISLALVYMCVFCRCRNSFDGHPLWEVSMVHRVTTTIYGPTYKAQFAQR